MVYGAMSSVQAKGGTRSARVLYHQCIEGEGWGTFFSAKSLLDIYNIFRVPYKTISMKSSLLFSVSHSFATLCFPTCSFLALTVLSHCSTDRRGHGQPTRSKRLCPVMYSYMSCQTCNGRFLPAPQTLR